MRPVFKTLEANFLTNLFHFARTWYRNPMIIGNVLSEVWPLPIITLWALAKWDMNSMPKLSSIHRTWMFMASKICELLTHPSCLLCLVEISIFRWWWLRKKLRIWLKHPIIVMISQNKTLLKSGTLFSKITQPLNGKSCVLRFQKLYLCINKLRELSKCMKTVFFLHVTIWIFRKYVTKKIFFIVWRFCKVASHVLEYVFLSDVLWVYCRVIITSLFQLLKISSALIILLTIFFILWSKHTYISMYKR